MNRDAAGIARRICAIWHSASASTSSRSNSRNRPVLYTAEKQGRIDSAEGKVVRCEVFDIDPARFVHHIVELGAAWINFAQVGSVRQPAVSHHADRQPRFDGAAGAQGMAEMTFQRMKRNVPAIGFGGGLCFRNVAPFGRGAVSADEANVGRGEA